MKLLNSELEKKIKDSGKPVVRISLEDFANARVASSEEVKKALSKKSK